MVTYYRDALACRFDPGSRQCLAERVEITDALPNTHGAGSGSYVLRANLDLCASASLLIRNLSQSRLPRQRHPGRPRNAAAGSLAGRDRDGGGSRGCLPEPDGRAIIGKYEEGR